MLHSRTTLGHQPLLQALDLLSLVGGIVLIVVLSWEILTGQRTHFSSGYMLTQSIVCVVFLLDFFVHMWFNPQSGRFFIRNFPFLLLSIPYLNIVDWCGTTLDREWAMLLGLIPLLRSFLALFLVVRWLVDTRIKQLFIAYLFTVVAFNYLSALVLYDYEIDMNPALHTFGDAVWWAWLNFTTVGANLFAVTTVGKVTTILLPSLGMLMFPIFTVYVVQEYTHQKPNDNNPA